MEAFCALLLRRVRFCGALLTLIGATQISISKVPSGFLIRKNPWCSQDGNRDLTLPYHMSETIPVQLSSKGYLRENKLQ